MATLTLRKRQIGPTEEHPNVHNLLAPVRERIASVLDKLSGPPTTERKRIDDRLFTTRWDRLYPRG